MITMWDDFKTAVQAIDVAALDPTGLGDLAAEIGATRAVLDGLEARTAVELRRLGASEASAAETLRRRTGCSAREAKHRARRAETLEKMPIDPFRPVPAPPTDPFRSTRLVPQAQPGTEAPTEDAAAARCCARLPGSAT